MIETLALIGAAILVRGSGAMVRSEDHGAALRLCGWILCAAGIWLLAGSVGAWFPLWPALLVGAVAGLIGLTVAANRWLMPLVDAGIVVMCGLLSIPMLAPDVILATAVLAAAVGLLLDRVPPLLLHRARVAAFGAPVLLGVGALIALDRTAAGGDSGAWHRSPAAVANLAISHSMPAQRIELEGLSGQRAVAWLERPRTRSGGDPLPGAMVFHGNHPAGSHQAAACALRRALLQAGYVVLSLDHPGYGATPAPKDLTDAAAWDPAPIVAAALRRLRSEPNVGPVVAVGHSMGCLDVLRAFAVAEPPNAAIVFGMGVFDPPPSDERWTRQFIRDRNLLGTAIDVAVGAEIRTRYHEVERLLQQARQPHPPLLFVRFGMEHENLVVGRERALDLFHEPPMTWDLDSTHYFSASERFGIIFGDARITRKLVKRLHDLHVGNHLLVQRSN